MCPPLLAMPQRGALYCPHRCRQPKTAAAFRPVLSCAAGANGDPHTALTLSQKVDQKKKVAGSLAVCEGKGAANRGNFLTSSCDFSIVVQVPFICAKHGQKDGSQLGLTEEF